MLKDQAPGLYRQEYEDGMTVHYALVLTEDGRLVRVTLPWQRAAELEALGRPISDLRAVDYRP